MESTRQPIVFDSVLLQFFVRRRGVQEHFDSRPETEMCWWTWRLGHSIPGRPPLLPVSDEKGVELAQMVHGRNVDADRALAPVQVHGRHPGG